MKYKDFVDNRDLTNLIESSFPILEANDIDPNVFYNKIIENPELLNDFDKLLMEVQPLGQNAGFLGRTKFNPLNWGMRGKVARDTYSKNIDLAKQQQSMQQALQAYQNVPEDQWPNWLKQYKDNPNTYQKQAGSYNQNLATANVAKTHGGSVPYVKPTPPNQTPPQNTPPQTPPPPPPQPQPQGGSGGGSPNSQAISGVLQQALTQAGIAGKINATQANSLRQSLQSLIQQLGAGTATTP